LAGSGIIVGLMSGTSTDGIDAAAVRLVAEADTPGIELLSFVSMPYCEGFRQRLLAIAGDEARPSDIAAANFALGGLFAAAAHEALRQAGLTWKDARAIGCSGHTVSHVPHGRGPHEPPATLQIGEAAVIAEELGVPVVCDFRVRDIAAGGQGAPLVPYFDYQMLGSAGAARAVLNIGGIANVTILKAGCGLDEVVAFDTGPGNMPIDAAVRALFPDSPGYDKDGAVARQGRVNRDLLEVLLAHPYFARPAPKSCGREQFGESFTGAALRRVHDLAAPDAIATLTEWVGATVGQAIARCAAEGEEPWEIIVSGGGAHNPCLVETVGRYAKMPIRQSSAYGLPVDAKEAIAFAYLAWETLRGRPSNVPSATGAAGPRVLGKITPA